MASNNIDDEKPNLRPTKRVTATGKSIFLHHNPNQRSNKSYVHVTLENSTFDNQQPHVEYSLNKQQRWKIVNDFDDQSSLSSEDDFNTQSEIIRMMMLIAKMMMIKQEELLHMLLQFHHLEKSNYQVFGRLMEQKVIRFYQEISFEYLS
jgi:hypothetical protein